MPAPTLPTDPSRGAGTRAAPGVAARVRQTVAALGPVADRDPAEHERLRSLLAEVPRERRGRHWWEASILVDLAYRRRPSRAFVQLTRMRARREPADFQPFWDECVRVLTPYTLGPHGYKLALGGRDQGELWRGTAAVVAGIAELGHECFVNSGTLLGLVREGAAITHDDDVDLAVLLAATDPGGAAREWTALRARLAAAGMVNPRFDPRRRVHSKVKLPGGVGVDLFPAWASGGRMYVWPHTAGTVAAEDVLPLAPREVSGTTLLFPRHPEPLLEANYGPDWRTPDPTFRFDWAGARARFGEFVWLMGVGRDATGP